MAGALGTVLRAALTARLSYLRLAMASYVRDQAEHGRRSLDAYLIGAGFYVVAGVFMIAALLVGAAALFRWMELRYGLFTAFGVTAGALVSLSLLSIAIAGANARKPKKQFPTLASRLRVAMRAPAAQETNARRVPVRDPVASAQNTARQVLRAPPSPRASRGVDASPVVQKVGIAAAVGLIGWALARRYSQPSTPKPPQG